MMKKSILYGLLALIFSGLSVVITAQEDTCAMQGLSYFEDFSSYPVDSFPDCWSRNSTNVIVKNVDHSASKELRFYGYSGDTIMAVMPKILDGYHVSNFILSFRYRINNLGVGMFITGVVSDPNDMSTFTPVDTISYNSVSWSSKRIHFLDYSGTGEFIAFQFIKTGAWQHFLMDDILVEEGESCSEVVSINLGNISGSSISLSWEPGIIGTPANYRVEWVEEFTGNSNYLITSNATCDITGLNERTGYEVTISVDCGYGGYTDGVSANFRTLCAAENSVIVGNGTSSTYTMPINAMNKYSYIQQIYTHSELGDDAMDITGIAFQYGASNEMTRNITLYLGHITTDVFTSDTGWLLFPELKQVYEGTVTFHNRGANNWFMINLDSTFQYNGSDNIVVAVNDNTGEASSSNRTFKAHSVSDFKVLDVKSTSATTGYDPASPPRDINITQSVRNNIKFISCDNSVCSAPIYTITEIEEEQGIFTVTNPGNATQWSIDIRLHGDSAWTNFIHNAVSGTIIDGLEPSSNYEVRVSAVCDEATGFRSDSVISTFRTACSDYILPPYSKNFDHDYTGNAPYCWTRISSSTSSYPGVYSLMPASAPNSLRLETTTTRDHYIVLPEMDPNVEISTLQMNFNMRVSHTHPLEIGVMESATDTASFVLLYTINLSNTNSWTNRTIHLNAHDADTCGRFIAFKWTGGTSSSTLTICYIDDLEIDYTTACIPPTTLTMTEVDITSAVFTWSDAANSSWNVKYSEVGGAETTYSTQNQYDTLRNLTPATRYIFSVQADCSSHQSEWVSYEFETSCHPITQLPYTEDFDSDSQIPVCWTTPVTYDFMGTVYPKITDAQYQSPDHSVTFISSSSSARPMLVSPQIDLDIHTLAITFDLRTASNQSGFIEVGVMSDPADISTFETVGEYASDTVGVWQRITVNLDNITTTGTGNHIVLRHRTLSVNSAYWIDNIVIDTIVVINQYTISATATTGGSVSPTSITVNEGENATIAITPNPGYYNSHLFIDGVSVDTTRSYTFYNVDRDHTLEARFALIPIIVDDPCDAPENIQVTPLVDTAFVTWEMPENAIGWIIRYKEQSATEWITINCETLCEQTAYTLIGLDSLTTYVLQMATLCEDSTSLWSSEVTFTTHERESGISDITLENRIELYPNPAKDRVFINVKGENIQIQHIVLYDNQGKVCRIEYTTQDVISIDVSHLAPGIYFMHLHCGDRSAVKKIVIG